MTHSNPFIGHVVLDAPAEHPTLGFGQIAHALASIVLTSEPRFAVGIFGGWGSGKSTLMEEIERRVVGADQAIVVRFNAWRYERERHLIVPLLDTIRASLSTWAERPQHQNAAGERVRGIARRVGRVVRALVRATSVEIGVAGFGSVSLDTGRAIDELSPASNDPATAPQSLYYAAFQELAAAFADVEGTGLTRMVVFVDDLDRCLPTSALSMLESMKLFFDMPGFIFVVGLDERAVEAAVRTKFASQPGPADRPELAQQIEREYLKKIFQVPYTLPPMTPGLLDDLLLWLHQHGRLGVVQRQDLNDRVRRYLRFVAPDGRINPREVKRYLNAYTIRRMVRPDLDPNTMLALQTIDFRNDWKEIYEDVVLAEPDVFVEALGRYRKDDPYAFENLWPGIGVLPLELSDFLGSPEAGPLAETKDIERYLSFIEMTRSSQGWVTDAMRDVGVLRQHIRDLPATMEFASPAARDLAERLKDVIGRLAGYHQHSSGRYGATTLEAPLAQLRRLVNVLAPAGPSAGAAERSLRSSGPASQQAPAGPSAGAAERSLRSSGPASQQAPAGANDAVGQPRAGQLEQWRQSLGAAIDALQQELRLIRRSSAFAPA
jgi:hypothetical protein